MDYTSSSQHIKLPRSVVVLVEWHCLLTSGMYFPEFGRVSRGRFSSAFWGCSWARWLRMLASGWGHQQGDSFPFDVQVIWGQAAPCRLWHVAARIVLSA